MDYLYYVNLQFSNPKAPAIQDEVYHDFERAIQKFNICSRVARNKKEIIEYELLDNRTVRLRLKSSVMLPSPARSLRVITMTMLDAGYDKYIYGKQLFKAVCHEIIPDKRPETSPKSLANLKLEVIQSVLAINSENTLKEMLELAKSKTPSNKKEEK